MMFFLLSSSLRRVIHCLSALFFVLTFLLSNTQVALAASSFELDPSNQTIVEYLRLHVPNQDRNAWLIAEQKTWEPWLKKKKGFLGRQLFWDPETEEALLLISWANRSEWKMIPNKEIDSVQNAFEEIANNLTGTKGGNPFPIKSQGEFLPQ